MGITYCSRMNCSHLDCIRHQIYAPKVEYISIADLNDGWCFDPVKPRTKRERLLSAICNGTQKTAYSCNDTCKAMCGGDGGCAYCSVIADAIEKEFGVDTYA